MAERNVLSMNLESLTLATATTLRQHLARARAGSDVAVHGMRKSLQRLRVIAKLLQPTDRIWFDRENAKLRRIRNRLAPLRDAAARSKIITELATMKRWHAYAAALRQLASLEADGHAHTWSSRSADALFWSKLEREIDLTIGRVTSWPFGAFDEDVLRDALRAARKQVRRKRDDAEGTTRRTTRHELRRKLRQYAAMRQLTSIIREEEDGEADVLAALAKKCGKEGDLWMAVVSVRHAARERRAWGHLARALEHKRRKLCARHDVLLRQMEF